MEICNSFEMQMDLELNRFHQQTSFKARSKTKPFAHQYFDQWLINIFGPHHGFAFYSVLTIFLLPTNFYLCNFLHEQVIPSGIALELPSEHCIFGCVRSTRLLFTSFSWCQPFPSAWILITETRVNHTISLQPTTTLSVLARYALRVSTRTRLALVRISHSW